MQHLLSFTINDPSAVIPTRAHKTDIGYDLTAIKVWKRIGSRTTIYDTGIAVQPSSGYYTEILPRSSLSKTGYILANSVGIIDPDYTGTLKIAVTKVDDSLPELECPFVKFQLIMRKAEYFELLQVSDFEKTTRGEGGFGSTDVVMV